MADHNLPPEEKNRELRSEELERELPPVLHDPDQELEEQPEPGHNSILFSIGRGLFAIPLEDIDEIYRFEEITFLPTSPDFLKGIINVHGNLTSVISLTSVVGITDTVESGLTIILIPRLGSIAIQVDSTSGFATYTMLEEVTAGFGPSYRKSSDITFIEGVFTTERGLVSLINPEKLNLWIDEAFSKGDD